MQKAGALCTPTWAQGRPLPKALPPLSLHPPHPTRQRNGPSPLFSSANAHLALPRVWGCPGPALHAGPHSGLLADDPPGICRCAGVARRLLHQDLGCPRAPGWGGGRRHLSRGEINRGGLEAGGERVRRSLRVGGAPPAPPSAGMGPRAAAAVGGPGGGSPPPGRPVTLVGDSSCLDLVLSPLQVGLGGPLEPAPQRSWNLGAPS